MELLDPAFWSMFFSAFLAATIIPFSSEVGLGTLLYLGYSPLVVILGATIGNTLGGMTGYAIGRLGKWEWAEKYMKVSHSSVESWANSYERYKLLLAAFCWLPFLGDFLCVLLGFMRAKWLPTATLMFIGKGLRYVVVAFLIYELKG